MFVCVMGRRFSGSTIVGRILDASPDVFCIGETLSIIDGSASCSTCGGKCKIVNYSKLSKLPKAEIYRGLLKSSGKKVLVTTDKPFHYVEKMTTTGGFVSLFAFKNLYAFAASEKRGHPRHRRKDGSLVFRKCSVEEAMEGFCEYYTRALSWKRPGIKYFVSLDKLVKGMPKTTDLLFKSLGVAIPKEKIDISKIEHHIALGNFDAMSSEKIFHDTRWKAELDDREKDFIQNHKRAQGIAKELMVRSIVH